MKKTKLAASLLAVSMLATSMLAGCDNDSGDSNSSGASSGSNSGSNSGDNSGDSGNSGNSGSTPENAEWKQTLTYADNTEIRMACGYNGPTSGISINADVLTAAGDAVKDGVLTLADGKAYQSGDLKPTWQAIESKLKFKIEDKYQGNSAKDEWAYWKEQLANVDFVAGNADALNSAGNEGLLLNIAQYLDSMPYFKAYLERNPIVRLSITSSVSGPTAGAIYFSPYFDGVNDIERMPLMRTDWVEKLLNGTDEFAPEKSGTTKAPAYQPYMPTEGSIEVEVVKADGSGKETITKDYSKYGNIIAKMNEVGEMSGKDAVKMLREYIDQTYGGYYKPENRADLFIGQNAAWDADELVALLRCVCANAQALNGTDSINGLFARNEDQCSRRNNLYQLAATLFGIRGLEGRMEYYYVGADNKLHDCRAEEGTYTALAKMNDLVKEGLISQGYISKNPDGKIDNYIANDNGFMEYDYSQTQTVYNENGKLGDGEEFRAVMVPIAYWDTDGDGTHETLMRFTESWRSVKTDAWAISLAGVGYSASNPAPSDASQLNDKAKALLTLIDYAYSKEGQILLSYGPDEFLKKDASGNIVTFDFNGEQWPEISEENYKQLWSIGKGNYTNYARYYIGSTLSFAKSQAFEYQCTTEAGRKGAGYISKAIALGTIKHPDLAINGWYTSVPTTLPNTPTEKAEIDAQSNLTTNFDTSGKPKVNILDDYIIVKGFTESGFTSAAEAATTVGTSYGANIALEQRNAAWDRMVDYYKKLNG